MGKLKTLALLHCQLQNSPVVLVEKRKKKSPEQVSKLKGRGKSRINY